MKRHHIKAAIFDMDGVITNTMPDHYLAWKAVLFAQAGINPTHLDIYLNEGSPGADCLIDIFRKHEKPYNSVFGRKLVKAKEQYFKKIARQRFIPGSRRFLRFLHGQGVLLALVTGTSRHELNRILPKTLLALFDVTISGSDVKKGKPHPEPYLTAVRKLGVKKSEAIVFENAPFGVTSAKKAGLFCVALETSLPKKYLNDADCVFPSFRDMLARNKFQKIS